MDVKKICFIMCVNNKLYMQEAIYYISRLNVPDGYTIDVLTVQDAAGMTSGYNEAMTASDAKYKVYLHQDVMITESDFIQHLLDLFQNQDIGMIGMVGTPKLPEDGVMWHSFGVGRLYSSNIEHISDVQIGKVPEEKTCQEVEAVDGLLIATQYDIKWRDDIFQKWDFYDVSQSFEFRRQGYKVVVPKMERSWCIHDDGLPDFTYYNEEREKFLKEYCSDIMG